MLISISPIFTFVKFRIILLFFTIRTCLHKYSFQVFSQLVQIASEFRTLNWYTVKELNFSETPSYQDERHNQCPPCVSLVAKVGFEPTKYTHLVHLLGSKPSEDSQTPPFHCKIGGLFYIPPALAVKQRLRT